MSTKFYLWSSSFPSHFRNIFFEKLEFTSTFGQTCYLTIFRWIIVHIDLMIIIAWCCHSKDSRPLIVNEVVQWIVGRIRLPQAMIIDRPPNCGFLVRAGLTFCTFFAFFAFFATLLYSKEPKYTNTPIVETSLILHPHYPKVSGLRFVLSGRLLDQHTKWTKWIPSDAMWDRKLFDFNLLKYFDRLKLFVNNLRRSQGHHFGVGRSILRMMTLLSRHCPSSGCHTLSRHCAARMKLSRCSIFCLIIPPSSGAML